MYSLRVNKKLRKMLDFIFSCWCYPLILLRWTYRMKDVPVDDPTDGRFRNYKNHDARKRFHRRLNSRPSNVYERLMRGSIWLKPWINNLARRNFFYPSRLTVAILNANNYIDIHFNHQGVIEGARSSNKKLRRHESINVLLNLKKVFLV